MSATNRHDRWVFPFVGIFMLNLLSHFSWTLHPRFQVAYYCGINNFLCSLPQQKKKKICDLFAPPIVSARLRTRAYWLGFIVETFCLWSAVGFLQASSEAITHFELIYFPCTKTNFEFEYLLFSPPKERETKRNLRTERSEETDISALKFYWWNEEQIYYIKVLRGHKCSYRNYVISIPWPHVTIDMSWICQHLGIISRP